MRIVYHSVLSSNITKLVAAALVGGMILQGCTSRFVIAPPEIPVADIEPLPATVGVFYSKTLATFSETGPHSPPLGNKISYVAGPASIEMFDIALEKIFEKVVYLQSWPAPNNVSEGLDAIIQPSLVNFSLAKYPPEIDCGMEYLVDFYLPDGEPLDSWRLRSNFSAYLKPHHMSESAPYKSVDKSLVEECVHLIMRDIVAQFIARSADRPALKSGFNSVEDQ